MSAINQTDAVKEQYKSATNLNTRISIHDKYSVNKMGFGNWIFSNYDINDGAQVLELGCGTGTMWLNRDAEIKKCHRLILSDFSEGMLETAKKNLSNYKKILYRAIDIQNIPCNDDTFNIVIANMMLYHVPDIKKALCEVKRVLKKEGVFYCATYGEQGITAYISKLLKDYGMEDRTNKVFTLQNGEAQLKQVFSRVERRDYEDSLAVTDVSDLADYIRSLTSMSGLSGIGRDELIAVLTCHMVNGVLNVPKEYGMFICRI